MVMCSTLLSCSILPGQSVAIGRKATLGLSINRPYLSSVHCRLDVPLEGGSCGVCDLSRNGTWWLAVDSGKGKPLKLTKGQRQELKHGDQVWLLSPHHKHCAELQFSLEIKDNGCVLRQLPFTENHPPRQRLKRRADVSNTGPNKAPRLDTDIHVDTLLRKPVSPDKLTTPSPVRKPPSHPHTPTPSPEPKATDIDTAELEHCPHCMELLPVDKLPDHSDLCTLPRPSRHGSLEQCPLCTELFPVTELIVHIDTCTGQSNGVDSTGRESISAAGNELMRYEGSPGSAVVSKDHVTSVPAVKVAECPEQEHCQHCFGLFPLKCLVDHALSCPQRGDLGSQEQMERCMHCFRDFPLSCLVYHSRLCEGEMLGPRDRFTTFLPSVHDVDPMTLSVLSETQMAAVKYVMEKSKIESERVHSDLKHKVVSLGYTENDLKTTLEWVRRDAPIIVHINLDSVLRFLVTDTHYRNLFEVGSSGGSTDTTARASWEDRIFNKIYKFSNPTERVKYGVLNIVGDPRGVQSCYGYGDSFLQLKKVRLRTTFASTDTSYGGVQLSCCEYYGNVLNQYSSAELQAILEVATKKQPFLRSNVISQYKEVQIHGPLCLSENVDCIVVNDRHGGDPVTRELLDQFVERNSCNLLWMDLPDAVGYPSTPSHDTPSMTFVSVPTLPAPPTRRRRSGHKRHRHRDNEW